MAGRILCGVVIAATWGLAGLFAADSASVDLDAQTIAKSIKALEDPAPKVREAAAAAIREIVARYPSHTVNIREADGGEARAAAIVAKFTEGLKKSDLEKLLAFPKHLAAAGTGRAGQQVTYQVDEHWRCVVVFNFRPIEEMTANFSDDEKWFVYRALDPVPFDRVVSVPVPPDFTGIWPVFFSNGNLAQSEEYRAGNAVAKK